MLTALHRSHLMLAFIFALAAQGAVSQAMSNNPRAPKKISLIEAKSRLDQAKKQVAADRLLLTSTRPRMNAVDYQTHLVQLDRRERLIIQKERRLKELIRTANEEKKIRENTGARFYADQESYYKHIYNDDIDLYLK